MHSKSNKIMISVNLIYKGNNNMKKNKIIIIVTINDIWVGYSWKTTQMQCAETNTSLQSQFMQCLSELFK